MSPATSLAKPLVRPTTQCPYCDHVSPAESKFCNECGAALHLMPCPHCGAVNDITLTAVCYRCHGELRKVVSATLPAPAATPATEPAERELPRAVASPYTISAPPARQRPHALVVAIVLVAFAAASYYAYRQQSALDVREPLHAEDKDRGTPAETNANAAAAGTIIKVPADATPNSAAVQKGSTAGTPAAVQVDAKAARPEAAPSLESTPASPAIAAAAARSNAGRSAAGREATESPAAVANVTPESARARIEASKGLEKQVPNIGPCTDAVAALGLCTPEPTPRRP